VANLVDWSSASLEQALSAASLTPASVIGAADRGRLDSGLRADVALFDNELRVLATTVGGVEVYRAEQP
jgi:N-acetylglucosamine-6-phosphate deacetylase